MMLHITIYESFQVTNQLKSYTRIKGVLPATPSPKVNWGLQIFIALVVAYIVYLLNTLSFIMKYNSNTANTRMYIDKSTINFTNENNFAGKRSMECKQNKDV